MSDCGLRHAGLLLVFVPSALALYALAERPLGFGLGIAAACGAALLAADAQSVLARERSFFGVYTIKRDPAGYHVLLHGTTMHGAQRLEADRRREPLTYFRRRTARAAVPRRRRASRTIGAVAWASAPSPATAGPGSAGRSTRSIRSSSGSRATSAISTTSPSAHPMPRSAPAMPV